jgi:hypothetical protein
VKGPVVVEIAIGDTTTYLIDELPPTVRVAA